MRVGAYLIYFALVYLRSNDTRKGKERKIIVIANV